METYDVVVIGAGQAALATAYYLQKKGMSFLLLERGKEVGEVWRNRYDSLVLFTPRFYSSLLGLSLSGPKDGYATREELADYLKQYAKHFKIPIQFNAEVLSLTSSKRGFNIETSQGAYNAKRVIVATGPFQKPYIPAVADLLQQDIVQVHTANYHNPTELKNGATVIIGAGNSGAQIAVELAKDREVYLSVGHPIKYMPLSLMGKSIFWWLGKAGILKANVNTKLGAFIRKRPDPIFGYELKAMIKQGKVKLKPRTIGIFADGVHFEDGSAVRVKNIVWATGFRSDYSWIHVAGVLDVNGLPRHERGISAVPGLFFVGLPWQYRRGSALIGGVGEDADFIVNCL